MVKFADGGNSKKKLQYLPWLTEHDADVCDSAGIQSGPKNCTPIFFTLMVLKNC